MGRTQKSNRVQEVPDDNFVDTINTRWNLNKILTRESFKIKVDLSVSFYYLLLKCL